MWWYMPVIWGRPWRTGSLSISLGYMAKRPAWDPTSIKKNRQNSFVYQSQARKVASHCNQLLWEREWRDWRRLSASGHASHFRIPQQLAGKQREGESSSLPLPFLSTPRLESNRETDCKVIAWKGTDHKKWPKSFLHKRVSHRQRTKSIYTNVYVTYLAYINKPASYKW